MSLDRELRQFGQPYFTQTTPGGLKWYWTDTQRIRASLSPTRNREIVVKLNKLPDNYSLTKLLVNLEDQWLKQFPEVDCYQGIAQITNNRDFSETVNYYLFEDGSITKFLYHKYHRNHDIKTIELTTYPVRWDGVAFNMRCKKISKRLAAKLTGLDALL